MNQPLEQRQKRAAPPEKVGLFVFASVPVLRMLRPRAAECLPAVASGSHDGGCAWRIGLSTGSTVTYYVATTSFFTQQAKDRHRLYERLKFNSLLFSSGLRVSPASRSLGPVFCIPTGTERLSIGNEKISK
jgi:hypothetical protein